MFKLFVFAAILAFAFAAPAAHPGPDPQLLVSAGVPVVSSVYSTGLVAPIATYTATGVVHPVAYGAYYV